MKRESRRGIPRGQRITFPERYEKHIIRNGEDECWGWSGPVLPTGYGYFNHPNEDGKWVNWRATRAAWVLFRGDLPSEMFVCHTCDNRICSNPKHLFLGTAADNGADMARKGRGRKATPKAPRVLSGKRRGWLDGDLQELQRLYDDGSGDREIAAALSRPLNSITTRRIAMGLLRHGRYSNHKTLAERFEKHVVRPSDENECWGWSGSIAHFGYGALTYRDENGKTRNTRASRAAYALFCGDIPPGMLVCHRCDNPVCSNPKHLFLGTHADNMRDKDQKGRSGKRGAKLTDEEVAEIRRDLASGLSQNAIASRYGVSSAAIHKIAYRKTWKHVEEIEYEQAA